MKSAVQTRLRSASAAADLSELVKARLSLLTVATAMAGFALGVQEAWSWLLLAATLVGTALSASGAAALNQWWERGPDAQMLRTRGRPLPSGRLFPAEALLWSVALGTAGVAVLAISSGWVTAEP